MDFQRDGGGARITALSYRKSRRFNSRDGSYLDDDEEEEEEEEAAAAADASDMDARARGNDRALAATAARDISERNDNDATRRRVGSRHLPSG